MKRWVVLGLILCLLSVLLCGCGSKEKDEGSSQLPSSSAPAAPKVTASPAPVQKAKAVKVDADGGLNIRSEPSTDGEIVGLAEDGSKLPLLVEKLSDGWYQVEYQGKSAYVYGEYAKVVEVTLEEYNQLRAGDTSDASSSEASSEASSSSSGGGNGTQSGASSKAPQTASSATASSQPVANEDGE